MPRALTSAMKRTTKQCGICTVAMQSTGVYWIAVYDILEAAGLEVYLVNARETKNLPGRKSDVQESQWMMKRVVAELISAAAGDPHNEDILATAE